MAITSAGIGSGIDVETIVSGLMNVERIPYNTLSTQKTEIQSQISAFGTLKSSLSTFQTALGNLTTLSKFNAQKITSGDSSVFTATSTGNASVGDYSLKVTQLAQSHKLSVGGFSSTADTVGTGSITITLGTYTSGDNTFVANASKAPLTINIDSSNNTLAGVRDAINAVSSDVVATVIHDGTANRLVLTSKETGQANSIKITVSDDDTDDLNQSGLSKLAYDPTATAGNGKNLTQVQEARNALFNLDGIDISKASNTVSDVIDGVTLKLLKSSGGETLNLNIDKDDETIKKNVQSFVDAYNALNTSARKLTNYDETGKSNGVLLGDSTTRNVVSQIKSTVVKSLTSGNTLTSLNQIGVTFQRDGTLALNTTKLQNAIDNNFDEIGSLFVANGAATDSLVTYQGSTSNTKEGTYAVNVTQAATQGNMQGSGAPNLTIVAGVNDALNLNIDGTSYSIQLAAGTYASANALASALQSKISAAGSAATVSVNSGNLMITSANYGSVSTVGVTGGNGAADLFGSPTSSTGLNVAGTINGVAATGSARVLVGATSDASEGLRVKVEGTATGSRGTINFTRGIASQLDAMITNFLKDDGLLDNKTDGLTSSIDRMTKQQESLEVRLASIEARYRAQFTKLDTLMSSLSTTSSFLTQQIESLQSLSSQ